MDNDLPLILSGPILRRVEPTLVSVWLALSKPCSVELTVWNGRVNVDSTSDKFTSDALIVANSTTQTIQVGINLHLVVAILEIQLPVQPLLPGRLYSYNVAMQTLKESSGSKQDLKSLGLLSNNNRPNGKKHLALGYDDGFLPSFSLSPAKLEDLQIAHGSCRKINHPTDDALAWVDGFIKNSLNEPNKRLHQLLLTGDQIYADDVAQPVLWQLVTRGQQLLGLQEGIVEYLPLFKSELTSEYIKTKSEESESHPVKTDDKNPVKPDEVRWYPADVNHFPPGMRHQLMWSEARLTTVDVDQHLISFGEFAAMYLFNWCNELWNLDELKDFDDMFTGFVNQLFVSLKKDKDGKVEDGVLRDNWISIFKKREFVVDIDEASEGKIDDNSSERKIDDNLLKKFLLFLFGELPRAKLIDSLRYNPGSVNTPLDIDLLDHEKLNALSNAEWQSRGFVEIFTFAQKLDQPELRLFRTFYKRLQNNFGGKFKNATDNEPLNPNNRKRQVELFYETLPQVRRALANVPTYMVFDDHEITDDWNLCPLWRDRVLTTPLGRAVIRNGMLAFALFQGWGNDPLLYKNGKHKQLLDLANQLFAAGAKTEQDEIIKQAAVIDKLDSLFGLNQQSQEDNTEQLSWHFSLKGPKHLLLGLDCRTRRSFITRYGPPGNISDSALKEQIPESLPVGVEVAVVICSLPVFAAPLFDEVVAPLIYRFYDLKTYVQDGEQGIKGMPGTNPDAIEGWANDAERMEELLKRLEPLRKVVLLSGDVHYGSSQQMSYWKKGDVQPARFIQFISSGMRNVMGKVYPADRHIGRVQSLIAEKIGTERLGWLNKSDDLVVLPEGGSLVPALKSKLRSEPVLLPTNLPPGTHFKTEPDWRWRFDIIKDMRADFDSNKDRETVRPESISPEKINKNDSELTAQGSLPAYQAVVNRHAAQFKKSKHGRQVLVAHNLGIVTFFKTPLDNDKDYFLNVRQDLYAAYSGTENIPSTPLTPDLMTRHDAKLAAIGSVKFDEEPPKVADLEGASA